MKPGGIGSATTKSAGDIARSITKQVAQEPLEILKDATNQVTGIESGKSQESGASNGQNSENKPGSSEELKDKAFAGRRMQALQSEIEDIRKQNLVKELQRRISDGITPPIEDFSELSMEQKQVLNAQMEAAKAQMMNAKYANDESFGVPAVNSKPSRRFGAGQKHEAEKQQTRVEKPVPPSG